VVDLTIGIPTYDDFPGVYFTLQALRLYQNLEQTELLVVDNFGCRHTKSFVEDSAGARYVLDTEKIGTAAAKNVVFREARGRAVLCCDSHVLLEPGAIARLRAYYRDHPDTRDLLHGPLMYDELQTVATHLDPVWRGQMWGIWAADPRGLDPDGEPFEIPMQGMGMFSCRREAWPGFNPLFAGFGGEEGYIHEKVRRAGGRCLCVPWLRWLHRFGRPAGVPYPLAVADKLRNYVIGFLELGWDLDPVLEHFFESLPEEQVEELAREALASHRGARSTTPTAAASRRAVQPKADAGPTRRAIVCFVEDEQHLVQQLMALRRSWLHVESPDTDLVAIGPAELLERLPEDLVKIPQRPAADDPAWQGFRLVNSIACLNGAGAEQLNRYSHLLHTHSDTFITPAWNRFYPDVFTWGRGGYANDSHVARRLRELAEQHGLTHRGHTNIGVSWYGPTDVVRRTAALAELLTKHLIRDHFSAEEPGRWPGWYRGVAHLYAAEIAVNHCAPFGRRSNLLDAASTSEDRIDRHPHIHCRHTSEKFSKHAFMAGRYGPEGAEGLDLDVVRDYCLAMSFRSLEDLKKAPARSSSRNGKRHLPLVSCLCPTYNRPPDHQHLVEEAVESFLRQTYPNKELILLNDCPGQELACDGPGVTVVNVPRRFASLGEKLNAAAALARGDLLAPWDDDDISLPWRLARSVELIAGADYFNPRCYWMLDADGLHFDGPPCWAHNASIFTRPAFEAVNGYPAISFGADAALDVALSALEVVDGGLGSSDCFYIYRWGVSPVHLSGRAEGFYRDVAALPITRGRFELSPHWRDDYVAATRALETEAAAGV
jgi:glycosyltransferase involved in cell wall biosynthesis